MAYSRPASLNRLLASLERIRTDHEVPLVISVDGGHPAEVAKIATNFNWPFGCKKIYLHDTRRGLKDHILWCGDLSNSYDGVVILEDDLVVAPGFYDAALSMLKFYSREPRIAGVALYSPAYNEISALPFTPIKTGFSNFFYQMPCSWGQAWTSKQWASFRLWMKNDAGPSPEDIVLPKKIKEWPNTSWKRWFSFYLVKKKKFFVYPYNSFTTNCADAGCHFSISSNRYQVPLSLEPGNSMAHPEFWSRVPVYDIWGEMIPSRLSNFFDIPVDSGGSLEVDIHCVKQREGVLKAEHVLTAASVDEEEISWPLILKPIENNLAMINCSDKKLSIRLGKPRRKNIKVDFLMAHIRLFVYYYSYSESYKVIFYFFWCFFQDIKRMIFKLKKNFFVKRRPF